MRKLWLRNSRSGMTGSAAYRAETSQAAPSPSVAAPSPKTAPISPWYLPRSRGGELVEGLSVLGEQVARSGFRAGQQVGDFLVDEPLSVLGVAALPEGGVPVGLAGVADRSES